ncbi:hypothetical protein M0R45_033155 [Rubus argutus]|uniref:Helicase C-terminal domain-containing protein n=1 Tax=Rubus argutus TaxID=59490 RepID=A0AAW1WIY9_RUBAR
MATVPREELTQEYRFLPADCKDCYLNYILTVNHRNTAMVFVRTSETAHMLALILDKSGINTYPITSDMRERRRLAYLRLFKTLIKYGSGAVLICTDDVESGELDFPSVDMVVNYDIPSNSQNYPHSVGRAAQAGRCGLAISLANQCEVENNIKIEKLIGKGIPEFPFYKEEDLLVLLELSTKTKRLVASAMFDRLN